MIMPVPVRGILTMLLVSSLYAGDHKADKAKDLPKRAVEVVTDAAKSGQELSPFYKEAKKRGLPTRFFDELIQSGAWVVVKTTSGGPQYRPGVFSGGTIYIKSVDTPLDQWNVGDFSNFYNELFHAWWANVFLKNEKYSEERRKLLTDQKLKLKYDRAFPGDPRRAQEEAYSETVATLITLIASNKQRDPATQKIINRPFDMSKLYYRPSYSVAPVSHSDVPGYTEEAENIFPNEEEYRWLFKNLFNQEAPEIPQEKKK